MNRKKWIRRIPVLLIIGIFFLLTGCHDRPVELIPPLPTVSEETPEPSKEPEYTPTPSPTPSPEETAEPVQTETPTPSPTPSADPNMPQLTISEQTLPENMVRYNVAELHGRISTDKGSITMVWGLLTDSGGNIVQECTFTPWTPAFSLAGTVNAALQFAMLEPDTYSYQVFAVAENEGLVNEQRLIDHSFTVYESAAEMRAAADEDSAYSSKRTDDGSNSGQIWNYLVSQFDNPYAAAAILSNIYIESGCNPMRVQDDFSENGSFSQAYTEKVDSGEVSREQFVNQSPGEGYGIGYGLCQWSGERKGYLYDFAKQRGTSVGDLATQCEFIVLELQKNYPELYNYLKDTDNVREANSRFCFEYEQPAQPRDNSSYDDYLEQYAS